MSKVTGNEIFNNALWRFLERILAQLITTTVSIVLARILYPEDYGAVALIMIFINLCNILVSQGFNSSLIQKEDADDLDFSTVFYISLVLTVVLYALIFCGAPLVADFYNIPALTPLLRVMAIRIPFTALNSIQTAYVSRNLQFKKYFFATIGGTLVSAVVGIAMAYGGLGAWALIGQYLSSTILNSAILWFTVRWRPKWKFSFYRAQQLFSYGWKILVSSLLDFVNIELTSFVIGKKYSAADLAFYNKGKQFPEIVNTNVNETITSIMFSVFSKEQSDKILLKAHIRKALKNIAFVMFPMLFGLAAVSEEFLILLLTPKWAIAIPFMQIFCISCIFRPINSLNIQAINAMGESGKSLKMTILKTVTCIAVILASIPLDAMLLEREIIPSAGIVIAFAGIITAWLTTLLHSLPLKRLIGYGLLQEFNDLMPTILPSCFMAVAVWSVGLLNLPIWISLLVKILVGVILYVGMAKMLKHESLSYGINLLKTKVRRKMK